MSHHCDSIIFFPSLSKQLRVIIHHSKLFCLHRSLHHYRHLLVLQSLSTKAAISKVKSVSGELIINGQIHLWPIGLRLLQHRIRDAHACLLRSIHRRGRVTPPPLSDCFLLSLLLNYFSSDSHMWVSSSLAGRHILWRRQAEAQLTGGASWTVLGFKERRQTVAPPPVLLLNSLSLQCTTPPLAPSQQLAKLKCTINSSLSHIV